MNGKFLGANAAHFERSVDGEYEIFTLIENGQEVGSNKLAKSPIHEPALANLFPNVLVAYQLFVVEAHRGRGLASLLMDAVEQAARDKGAARLLLGVVVENVIARGLYERRGYEYLEVDGNQTVDSVWNIKNENGKQIQEIVQVMPMMLHLKQNEED